MQGQSSCVKSPHVLYSWYSLHGKVLRKVKVLAQNLPMYHIGGALYMGRFYARSKFLRKIFPCIVPTCYTGIILHVA